MTIHGPISNILIMCFVYYLFSWTINPRPRIKYFDYVCCLLPSFLIHESTAPYQTSWLCVLFTTFFVHEHIPLYQTYWLCILFTTFFHPWIHTPDIKSLDYVFCLLPFFIHECTALNQTPWLCVLLTTCFDSWIHGPDIKSIDYVFYLLPFLIHESTAPKSNLLIMCFVYYRPHSRTHGLTAYDQVPTSGKPGGPNEPRWIPQ